MITIKIRIREFNSIFTDLEINTVHCAINCHACNFLHCRLLDGISLLFGLYVLLHFTGARHHRDGG